MSELRRLFKLFSLLYREDTKFLVLKALSAREGASMRELGRIVGIHYKNLSKPLLDLNKKGVVESFEASPKMRVYRLSREYEFLRDLFKQA